MSDRTRVAVVGAGLWGRNHARVFASHPYSQLVAVCGRSEAKTRARAEEFGVPAYLDVAKMLDAVKPDLVSLSLPNLDHFEPTLAVIRAGYPLLVEKPLVFELEQADQLLAEADERGLFFAINFNHRYAKPVQLARQAVEAGKLGPIRFATWRFGGEGSCAHHPHANLIETQCHAFDMLELLGGPIESISAEMAEPRAESEGYTTVVLALRFASGAVGSLVGSYDSSYAYRGTHQLEVNGQAGRIWVEDTVAEYRYQAAGSETAEVWRAGYFNDPGRQFGHTFDRHAHEVLQALRDGAPPPVHARAGRRALALAHAAIRAFESGSRVVVGE